MTTRDIQKHFEEIYGAEISATMVSNGSFRFKTTQSQPVQSAQSAPSFQSA